MRIEDDVDAPDGVDSDGDGDMERDSDDEVEEDEQEEDEEEEDEDEDDGKEPRTIGQGEMVNTLADNVDTMVNDQPIVLPEQGQKMREHTPRPQPPAPASRPLTLERRPRPRTPETHPLTGLEDLGLLTSQKPQPVVPKLQEAEAARNTSDVDVNQQLLIESAGGDSLSDVPLADVPLPDVAFPDVALPEVRPDGSVGKEWTSPRVAEEVMVVGFGSGSGSCLVRFLGSNLFTWDIDYYTRREVFGSRKVHFIYGFCTRFILIGFSLFIVLWDIGHAACLQLLVCNEPPSDGVEAQYVSWKYRERTHEAAQAQHQLSSLSTVYTPLLPCRRQFSRRPLSVAPNFRAERSSPLTAGDLNISNYTILNTFKLLARRIWLFAAHPDTLNPLSVVTSTLTKIQSKTWTRFPTSNTLKTYQTRSLNHRHLLCHGRKHTPAPALRCAITLLSYGNMTVTVALRRTYKTIPITGLWHVKSTNISSVGSRRRAWRRTMTTWWMKKTTLCVSQASKTEMASRSSWLPCQIIRLSGSGNYTLSSIWDGMTITNAVSNTGVEISLKAWDGWCSSQPTRSISFTPLSIAVTAISHWIPSILKYKLRTGGERHR